MFARAALGASVARVDPLLTLVCGDGRVLEEDISPTSPDGRVAAVVENWFPRFLANGLDYLDVRRTIDSIASWEEWPKRWVETGERYEALGDEALRSGHEVSAGAHLQRAALTYHFAQFTLTDDLEGRERIHRRMARVYRSAAPLLLPPAEPFAITSRGVEMRGYLRRPAGEAAAPLVILLPGLESTKEQFGTFEPHLLERGLATLSFEGPGQGETWYEAPFDIDAYLEAATVLRDEVRRIEGIATGHLGVLGTSFGGHLALRTAPVLCPRAVVDIAGPYDLVDLDSLQPLIRENLAHFMKVPPAQLGERAPEVSLAGVLPIDASVLVVHGEQDNIIPFANARRILGEQPAADALLFAEGNHSCNNLHTIVRPAVADWLADGLLAS